MKTTKEEVIKAYEDKYRSSFFRNFVETYKTEEEFDDRLEDAIARANIDVDEDEAEYDIDTEVSMVEYVEGWNDDVDEIYADFKNDIMRTDWSDRPNPDGVDDVPFSEWGEIFYESKLRNISTYDQFIKENSKR